MCVCAKIEKIKEIDVSIDKKGQNVSENVFVKERKIGQKREYVGKQVASAQKIFSFKSISYCLLPTVLLPLLLLL